MQKISKSTLGGVALALLVSLVQSGYSQNDVWFYGTSNRGIDFSGGAAANKNGVSAKVFDETVTVTGDGSGNVLFYSDGSTILDGTYTAMPNGTISGSGGGSAVQGALSIKKPGSSDSYYVFTTDQWGSSNGISWHEIDMTAAGNGTVGSPEGDVISKNNSISARAGEMLSVANNCGSTVWVLGHEHGNSNFIATPVTSAGVGTPVVTSIGASFSAEGYSRGAIAFNSDGSKFVITGLPNIRIFDFDITTGVVSGGTVISATLGYGAEWSPDDAVVYFSGLAGTSNLYHYNVATTTFTNISTAVQYGELVKANDGKIYSGVRLGTSLAVIDNPNSTTATAVGVGLNPTGWASTNWTTLGLPQSFACAAVVCPDTTISTPDNVCIGGTEDLSDNVVTVEAGSWSITSSPGGDFDATITGGNTFDASLLYNTTGDYTLTYTLSSPTGGCPSSASRTITVYDLPDTLISNPLNICAGLTEDLSDDLVNTDPGTWTIVNAPAGATPATISGGSTFDASNLNTNPGTYTLRYTITSPDGGCARFSEKLVTVYPNPVVSVNNIGPFCLDASDDTLTAALTTVANCDTSYVIDQFELNVEFADTEYVNLVIGQEYEITVTGEHAIDATRASDGGFSYDIPFAGVTANASRWRLNGSVNPMRPSPNSYNASHEYTFYYTATQVLNYFHYFDAAYGDNTGSLTFSIKKVSCSENFTWQINDVTDASNRFDPGTHGVGNHEIKLIYSNAFGCTIADSATVVVDTLPVVNLGNDTAICADANITFDAGAGYTYAWTPGAEITQTINVNTANTYGVTITDGNGCTGTDNIILSIDTLPVVDLGNDTAICADANITFDAGTGYTYAWTPGSEITQTINLNTANTYDVTITDGNGCTGTDNITLTIDTLPVVDLGNDTAICADANITFDAGAGYTYAWTPGAEITQTINVNTANTYGVTITDGNGCVGTDNITLSIDTLPVVDLGNDTAICADANITFDAGAGYTYAWTPGAEITQTIFVNTANTYGVTITDGNGCVGTDNIILSIDTLPVVDLGNDTSICAIANITFDAGVGYTYAWTPNSETTQTINVNTANTYGVTITDGNGCTGSDNIVLGVTANPVVNLGADQWICEDDSLTLDAGLGFTYVWTPNGETSQTIVVDTAAIYGVVISDGAGCVGSDSMTLTIDTLPVVSLGNDTAICADETIAFDAGVGYTYVWTPNGENTQTITGVNTTGTFGVVITDGNGCVGSDSIDLTVDTIPYVYLGPDSSICAGDSMILDAGSPYVYSWDPTGEVSQTIVVKTAGVYSVEITDEESCIGRDTVEIFVDTIPNLFLGNDTAICADKDITLDAGAGYVYQWFPSGATTQDITVNTVGTYGVVITDGNDCNNYDQITVLIDTLPIIDLGNDTSICIDSTLTLDAMKGASWLWSTAETTQDITVNTSNTYDVEVTDGNGCKGRDTIVVGINQLPIVDLGNDTSICADSLIVFDAGNTTAGWLWSNAETTQQISVDTASSYSVIVTDTNGCVGYDTLVLSIDTLPVVFLGVDTAICADSTLLLDAQNVGGTYLWNTGVNSRTINVNSSGTYDVVVTTTKGCVGYDTIALDINQLPTPDLGIDSSLCSGDAMELFTGLSDISLLWIPTNETTDTIVVSTAGTYEVMVTDTNNCVGYDTVVVTVDALPIVDLGIDSSLCAGDEMTIYAGNAGSTYVWNNGSTDENITIDSAFTYIVTVTNPAICSVSDTVVVTVDSVPVVDLGMDTAICNLDSITFDAGNAGAMFAWSTGSSNQSILVKSSGSYRVTVTNSFNCVTEDTVNLEINELPDVDLGPTRDVCEYLYIDLGVAEQGAISYAWSTGATTDSISINTAGTYYLDVVDTNNCFKSDTVVVTPGPDLVVEIEADSVICAGEETEATVLVDNETGLLSYTWNTTATTESIEVNTTGTYSVVVIDAKGCWGDDSQGIRVQALPTLTITPDTLSMCSMEEAEETSLITAAHNGSYVEWGDGFIGDVYTTEESGWFEATVMDDFGCSAYDSVTIVEYCRPINITLPNIFTPDGDGINDAFIPFEIVWEDLEYMMAHIEYINFKVYNRWGELIHLSTEVLPRWKGLNARGVDAPDGTYFWTLEYRDIDGGEYFNNGYVKLRR